MCVANWFIAGITQSTPDFQGCPGHTLRPIAPWPGRWSISRPSTWMWQWSVAPKKPWMNWLEHWKNTWKSTLVCESWHARLRDSIGYTPFISMTRTSSEKINMHGAFWQRSWAGFKSLAGGHAFQKRTSIDRFIHQLINLNTTFDYMALQGKFCAPRAPLTFNDLADLQTSSRWTDVRFSLHLERCRHVLQNLTLHILALDGEQISQI